MTDLGVVTAVRDVVGVVDDTTALLGEVTNGTVPPVLEALDPTTPDPIPGTGVVDPPVSPTTVAAVSATQATSAPILGGSVAASARASAVSFSVADLVSHESAPATEDTATARPRALQSGSPPGTPVPASSSAGPGGGVQPCHRAPSAMWTLLRSVLASGHPAQPTTCFLRRLSPTPTSLLTDGPSRRSPGDDRCRAARAL